MFVAAIPTEGCVVVWGGPRVRVQPVRLRESDRTKTRNGLGNGSIKLRFVALQVVERAFMVIV